MLFVADDKKREIERESERGRDREGNVYFEMIYFSYCNDKLCIVDLSHYSILIVVNHLHTRIGDRLSIMVY